jgi:hypothetical protein
MKPAAPDRPRGTESGCALRACCRRGAGQIPGRVGCGSAGRAGGGARSPQGSGLSGWAPGGAVLVEAGLVLPASVVRDQDLDRAASGDCAAGVFDRAGPGSGPSSRSARGTRRSPGSPGNWGWPGGR